MPKTTQSDYEAAKTELARTGARRAEGRALAAMYTYLVGTITRLTPTSEVKVYQHFAACQCPLTEFKRLRSDPLALCDVLCGESA